MKEEVEPDHKSQAMPAMDALAIQLDIKTDIKSGEVVTETGRTEPARKSLSDFIPTEVLLGFIISVLWKITQKVSETAREVELSDGEIKTLSNGWAPVMDEYMPNIPDGNLSNALIVTGIVAAPKFIEAKKKAKAKEKMPVKEQPGNKQEAVEQQKQQPEQKPELKPESSRKK